MEPRTAEEVEEGRQFREADIASLGPLLDRHDAALLSVAERLCGDRPEALDLRQETWLRALRRRDLYDGRAPLRHWLLRILLNECRDRARRRALERMRRGVADGETLLERSAEETAVRSEDSQRVRAAVLALPEDEREALVLQHYQGMSLVDTARLLGRPRSTVQATIARGLRRLERALRRGEADRDGEPRLASRREGHAL